MRERMRVRQVLRVGRGVLRVFLLAVGFGSGRAGVWRGLAVPGCRSVPDSGDEEPCLPGLDSEPIPDPAVW